MNNQNHVRVVRSIKFPSKRGVPAGRGVLPECGVPERRGVFSESRVPERRGVFSENGEEHPVIASQCHPSTRGESTGRGVLKWYELPFNPKLKQRARELRKAGNLSEVLFWNQVKNNQFLKLDFDRQKIIGNYIVDFYCKELGVVVEIDGGSHNEKQEYDKERDNYLESFGLKIFHIQDIDIKKNLDGVFGFLRESLTPRPTGTPINEGN
ncbi:MAG: hypothetical protein UT02_C0017G0023 [Parcubacteria group bacterium GW2011_GWC2_38_7]|nr:MAG: hypothetical protein UT02_C0017G0023 [Parcubacteria group bacterium GW2011_GWC2_38_7]